MAWVSAFEARWPQCPKSHSRGDPLLEGVAIPITIPIPIPIPAPASPRDWRAVRLTILEHSLERPLPEDLLVVMLRAKPSVCGDLGRGLRHAGVPTMGRPYGA